jgi:hypothetical protein
MIAYHAVTGHLDGLWAIRPAMERRKEETGKKHCGVVFRFVFGG